MQATQKIFHYVQHDNTKKTLLAFMEFNYVMYLYRIDYMKVYYVYILTNPGKTILYIGVTNNLQRRLDEHRANKGKPTTFAGKYYCHKLIYTNLKYKTDQFKTT